MYPMRNLSKYFLSIFLATVLLFSSILTSPPAFANDFELSPAVSEIGETFSDKYCVAISDGSTADKAALVAGRQMISSLMRSGALKEVMAVPKEDMASFIAKNIFEVCGDNIGISEIELNASILNLANQGPSQSQSKPFNPSSLINKNPNT
ncbi:MAG TPA: hypothetical protein QF700_10175 [Prochlorococcus sp.]|nr:hypothetical protein [Prochlorococcus sp.]